MNRILVIAVVALCLILVVVCFRPARVLLLRYEKLFTLLFAIVGGFYVLLEYRDSQPDAQVEKTLAYVQRVQSGDVAEARQWIDEFWLSNAAALEQFSIVSKDEKRASDAEAIRKHIGELATDDSKGKRNIMRMFDFYADLATCTNLGICDKETSCIMFSKEIGNTYVFFADFLKQWTNVSFGDRKQELLTFVRSCK